MKVFLSHSSKDKDLVRKVNEKLGNDLTWFDAMEIDNEIIIDDNTSIIIIPNNLLNKIQNGAKISKFFPRRLKKYFDLF